MSTSPERQPNPADSNSDPDSSPSRYVVGIDLGTTNCALCFVDTHKEDWTVETFAIEQWVDLGQIEKRETLPSFHYQLTQSESSAIESGLPWEQNAKKSKKDRPGCVGVLARDAGTRHPGRRISSAKSWLSHDGVDRTADFLPWHGDPDVSRLSPLEASAEYLKHLRQAWDQAHPDEPLKTQDIVITLPASFDEVARELTIKAAKLAGLKRVYLIEEPQAAFYAWIDRHRQQWPDLVRPGQLILVCDIGGGTTDLTLIRVQPAGESGDQVQFHRVAVGKHLILGGDNMDLAVAKLAESKFAADQPNTTLSAQQWDRMVQSSRIVKETMLGDDRPESFTLNVAAEGAKLLAGAIQVQLSREDIDAALLDGFFPKTELTDRPVAGQSGFQEFGLPYAADPGITRHLAEFLCEHRRSGLDDSDQESADRPDLVLFNGGVMTASAIQNRIVGLIKDWFAEPNEDWSPTVLTSPRLDLAVAHGAAYYAMVRRGQGVRIAANLGRSYYMQVQGNPPQALCLIPGNAEAGQQFRVDEHPLRLQIGQPVQFPLWVSSTRLADRAGELIAIDPNAMTPLPPICTALVRGRRREDSLLEVYIESELSEIGTVGMYCVNDDGEKRKRWKLEFDIRSTLETDRQSHSGEGEVAGVVDVETVEACANAIVATFAADPTIKPRDIIPQLETIIGAGRDQWPPTLIRELWQFLLDHETGRRMSPAHEARWLNMSGFCLRPGYGVAVDDWRVQSTWKQLHGKLAFPASQSRTESMILWRRIAGGLTAGQQEQLASPMLANLRSKTRRIEPHEANEFWRLIASLERLKVADKVELGEIALVEMTKKKNERLRSGLLWAIGRIGSRQPAYGPLNSTVPVPKAEFWVKRLIEINPTEKDLPLAIAQIARLTGDRYRDLSEEVRKDAANYLDRIDADPHFARLLREGGELGREEQSAVFGDTLPLGIQLGNG
ncbi:hsp70 family protein [Rhodopirellula sp. MGV]|uniref:hsp70 family protein n=1 Tax=Rhodopirellula sp. MGV TaxID=2023130 RepID=UPI000B961A94|nr:hsp70 family protein [Rhodopirellula sp. MGV]OYP39125.1 molecular chaperone Hsp70 [Rhodopirellula sp. MGV]PNY35497.1 molecular chaperone Hsp70 [Rhodopirellula baltica]